MQRSSTIAMVLAVVVAGCGSGKAAVSPACSAGATVIEKALAAAPAAVALPDGTTLSKCISSGTGDADLQNVGIVFFTVAEKLGDRARAGGAGAALQLGYLIGATRRGAAKTNGIMAELQRRVELVGSRLGQSQQPALQRGRTAGEATG